MKSDPQWNEIQERLKLKHPSASFTDEVIEAVRRDILRAQASPPTANVPPGKRRQAQRAGFGAEVMNALLATAATFLFVATGLWSEILPVQGAEFGVAVQGTVTQTLFAGIDWIASAIASL